jgi:hypothetical protein
MRRPSITNAMGAKVVDEYVGTPLDVWPGGEAAMAGADVGMAVD